MNKPIISFSQVETKVGRKLQTYPRFIRISDQELWIKSDSQDGYHQLFLRGKPTCSCQTFALPGYNTCPHVVMASQKYKLQ
jgi:hypothetical protein